MKPRTPLFNRYISAPRRPWLRAGISGLLILSALAVACLAGVTDSIGPPAAWRTMLIGPAVIAYIVLVAPILARTDDRVVCALRPLISLEDAEFARLTDKATYSQARYEVAIGCAGLGFGGAVTALSGAGFAGVWGGLYWGLTTSAMYALLAWTIYAAITGARMISALHRQPMSVNTLDTSPFEAVGRQSLLLALTFIGGITLSLIVGGVQQENLSDFGFWLSYAPIIAAPVLVFYLNMLATHRVLATAKKRSLAATRCQLEHAGQDLVQRLAEHQDTGSLAATVATLIAYEHRLTDARTWPYNTAMLRTLFFSLLLPIGTALLQMVWRRLFP